MESYKLRVTRRINTDNPHVTNVRLMYGPVVVSELPVCIEVDLWDSESSAQLIARMLLDFESDVKHTVGRISTEFANLVKAGKVEALVAKMTGE